EDIFGGGGFRSVIGQPAQYFFEIWIRANVGRRQLSRRGNFVRRQVRGPRRNPHRERRPGSLRALYSDAATMPAPTFVHQCQTNAGSFVRAPARVLHPVESFEHTRHVRRWNARARVTYRELDAIVHPSKPDGDLAFEGELERVGEKVQDDLLPHVAIDVDRLG